MWLFECEHVRRRTAERESRQCAAPPYVWVYLTLQSNVFECTGTYTNTVTQYIQYTIHNIHNKQYIIHTNTNTVRPHHSRQQEYKKLCKAMDELNARRDKLNERVMKLAQVRAAF